MLDKSHMVWMESKISQKGVAAVFLLTCFSSSRTALTMGVIIAVVAVLEIHMDKVIVVTMNPSNNLEIIMQPSKLNTLTKTATLDAVFIKALSILSNRPKCMTAIYYDQIYFA